VCLRKRFRKVKSFLKGKGVSRKRLNGAKGSGETIRKVIRLSFRRNISSLLQRKGKNRRIVYIGRRLKRGAQRAKKG